MTDGKAARTRPILLVEDDDVDAEAVQRALKKANLANPVVTACDGVAALDILSGRNGREKIEQPCVVLLDINLPRMNGLDFLKEMRGNAAMRRNVVFILTTSSRARDKETAYDLQAAGYILKENIGELAGMLARYCGINEFPG
jgi:CheY-like chemotaxis protein